MTCIHHPDRAAHSHCCECGVGLCEDCTNEGLTFEGKPICPTCLETHLNAMDKHAKSHLRRHFKKKLIWTAGLLAGIFALIKFMIVPFILSQNYVTLGIEVFLLIVFWSFFTMFQIRYDSEAYVEHLTNRKQDGLNELGSSVQSDRDERIEEAARFRNSNIVGKLLMGFVKGLTFPYLYVKFVMNADKAIHEDQRYIARTRNEIKDFRLHLRSQGAHVPKSS